MVGCGRGQPELTAWAVARPGAASGSPVAGKSMVFMGRRRERRQRQAQKEKADV